MAFVLGSAANKKARKHRVVPCLIGQLKYLNRDLRALQPYCRDLALKCSLASVQ